MKENFFWICGKHCVESAILNKKRKLIKLVATKQNYLFDKYKVNYQLVNKSFFIKNFKNISHQNIAAYVSNIKFLDFKNNINKIQNYKNIVILDNITDTGNIGNILRTCLMFKIDCVIINKRNFQQNSINMLKNACGAVDILEIFLTSNLTNVINILKNKNFWVTVIDMYAKKNMHEYTWHEKNILIFGSEEKGVKELLKKKSDFQIKINTSNNNFIDSLNISNVVAITLSNLFNSK